MSEISAKLVNPIFKETAVEALIIATIDATVIYEHGVEKIDASINAGVVSASISSIQAISTILLEKLQKDSLDSYILYKSDFLFVCQKIQEYFLIAKVKRNPDTDVNRYLKLLHSKGLPIVAELATKGATEPITAKVKQLFPEAMTIAVTSSSGSPISFLTIDKTSTVDSNMDFDELASYSAAIGLASRPLGATEGDSSISLGEKTCLISVNIPGDRILVIVVPRVERPIEEYLNTISEMWKI